MRFVCRAGLFHDALALLKAYQSPSEQIPSTQDVLIQVRGDVLALAMMGLKHAAILKVDISEGEDGMALVNPGRMLSIISRDTKAIIAIETDDRQKIHVSWVGERHTASIEGGVPESFPPIQRAPRDEYLSLTLEEALRVRSVLAPMKTEKLNYVQVTPTSEFTVDFVATDQWLLARTEAQADCPRDGVWYFPGEALQIIQAVARLLPIPNEGKVIQFQTTGEYAYLVFPGGFFRSLLPGAVSQIDYETFFRSHMFGTATVSCKDLVKNLNAAMAIASDVDATVDVAIEEDSISISAHSPLKGECCYHIPATIEGTPRPIKLPASHFQRVVKSLSGNQCSFMWNRNLVLLDDGDKEIIMAQED